MKKLKIQKALLTICLALPITLKISNATNAMENVSHPDPQGKDNIGNTEQKGTLEQEIVNFLTKNKKDTLTEEDFKQILRDYIDNNIERYLALTIQACYKQFALPENTKCDTIPSPKLLDKALKQINSSSLHSILYMDLLQKQHKHDIEHDIMTKKEAREEIHLIIGRILGLGLPHSAIAPPPSREEEILVLLFQDGPTNKKLDKTLNTLRELINDYTNNKSNKTDTYNSNILRYLGKVATLLQTEADNQAPGDDTHTLAQLAQLVQQFYNGYEAKKNEQQQAGGLGEPTATKQEPENNEGQAQEQAPQAQVPGVPGVPVPPGVTGVPGVPVPPGVTGVPGVPGGIGDPDAISAAIKAQKEKEKQEKITAQQKILDGLNKDLEKLQTEYTAIQKQKENMEKTLEEKLNTVNAATPGNDLLQKEIQKNKAQLEQLQEDYQNAIKGGTKQKQQQLQLSINSLKKETEDLIVQQKKEQTKQKKQIEQTPEVIQIKQQIQKLKKDHTQKQKEIDKKKQQIAATETTIQQLKNPNKKVTNTKPQGEKELTLKEALALHFKQKAEAKKNATNNTQGLKEQEAKPKGTNTTEAKQPTQGIEGAAAKPTGGGSTKVEELNKEEQEFAELLNEEQKYINKLKGNKHNTNQTHEGNQPDNPKTQTNPPQEAQPNTHQQTVTQLEADIHAWLAKKAQLRKALFEDINTTSKQIKDLEQKFQDIAKQNTKS